MVPLCSRTAVPPHPQFLSRFWLPAARKGYVEDSRNNSWHVYTACCSGSVVGSRTILPGLPGDTGHPLVCSRPGPRRSRVGCRIGCRRVTALRSLALISSDSGARWQGCWPLGVRVRGNRGLEDSAVPAHTGGLGTYPRAREGCCRPQENPVFEVVSPASPDPGFTAPPDGREQFPALGWLGVVRADARGSLAPYDDPGGQAGQR